MNEKIRDLKIRLMLEAEKELTEDLTEVQRYQYTWVGCSFCIM